MSFMKMREIPSLSIKLQRNPPKEVIRIHKLNKIAPVSVNAHLLFFYDGTPGLACIISTIKCHHCGQCSLYASAAYINTPLRLIR